MNLRVKYTLHSGCCFNTVVFEGTRRHVVVHTGWKARVLDCFCLITSIKTEDGKVLQCNRFSLYRAYSGPGSIVERIHSACANALRTKAEAEWSQRRQIVAFGHIQRAAEIAGENSHYITALKERAHSFREDPYANLLSITDKRTVLFNKGQSLITNCRGDLEKLAAAFSVADEIHQVLTQSFPQSHFPPFYGSDLKHVVHVLRSLPPEDILYTDAKRQEVLQDLETRIQRICLDYNRRGRQVPPALLTELSHIERALSQDSQELFASNEFLAKLSRVDLSQKHKWGYFLTFAKKRIKELCRSHEDLYSAFAHEQQAVVQLKFGKFVEAGKSFEEAARKAKELPDEVSRLTKARDLVKEVEQLEAQHKLEPLSKEFDHALATLQALMEEVASSYPDSSTHRYLVELHVRFRMNASEFFHFTPTYTELQKLEEEFGKLKIAGALDHVSHRLFLQLLIEEINLTVAKREELLKFAEQDKQVDAAFVAGKFQQLSTVMPFAYSKNDVVSTFAQIRDACSAEELAGKLNDFYSTDSISPGIVEQRVLQLKQALQGLFELAQKPEYTIEELEKYESEIQHLLRTLELHRVTKGIPNFDLQMHLLKAFPRHGKGSRNHIFRVMDSWLSQAKWRKNLVLTADRLWSKHIQEEISRLTGFQLSDPLLPNIDLVDPNIFIRPSQWAAFKRSLATVSAGMKVLLEQFRAGSVIDMATIWQDVIAVAEFDFNAVLTQQTVLHERNQQSKAFLSIMDEISRNGMSPMRAVAALNCVRDIIHEVQKQWVEFQEAFLNRHILTTGYGVSALSPVQLNFAIQEVMQNFGKVSAEEMNGIILKHFPVQV